MPNIEDFNPNSSDSQDYLEIKSIASDVKTSEKSHTVASPIDTCFHVLNPLRIVINFN